jgi:hypothetical protein
MKLLRNTFILISSIATCISGGDKISESWEASQEELKETPNKNGLF